MNTNMKKLLIAATVLLFCSGNSHAETLSPISLEVGVMYYNYDYKEDFTPPGKSTEKGWLPGIRIAYSYQHALNPLYGRVLFEYTDAQTDYDGATQSGVPVKGKTDNKFTRLEGNIGFSLIKNQPQLDLTVYSGIGFRGWERGLGGQYPYSEEYSWNYLPLGVRASYGISDRWSGAIDVAARIMSDGKMKINMAGTYNPTVTLGNKTGWYVEAPFYYKWSSTNAVFISPWYEYSAIGKSNTVLLAPPNYYAYEPSSTTNQFGVNVGVKLW